jgi:hypothetical protein
VAPLRLGGLRGKQSTPSVWLGGTGEHSVVGKREEYGGRDAARGAGLQSEGRGEKAQVRFSLNGRRKGYHVVLKFSDIDVIIFDILI